MGLAVIPDDWSAGYVSLCIDWPDSPDWRAILRGLLTSPNDEGFWDEFTGTPSDPQAAILPTFDNNLHLGECMIIPTGAIFDYAGVTEPAGWLFCFGQAVSRAAYAGLFAVISTRYGVGDGTTTFNIPDDRGRVTVGWSDIDFDFNDVGNNGGEKTHTLITSEIPSHNHGQDSHNHGQDSHNHGQNSHNHSQNSHLHQIIAANDGGAGVARATIAPSGTPNTNTSATTATNIATTATNIAATATNIAATATNQAEGGGGAHNNLQPYLVHTRIIKT